jgi:H+/Cl- antiporter ClcA
MVQRHVNVGRAFSIPYLCSMLSLLNAVFSGINWKSWFTFVLVGMAAGLASYLFLVFLEMAQELGSTIPYAYLGLPLFGVFVVMVHYFKYNKEVYTGINDVIKQIHSPVDGLSFTGANNTFTNTIATHFFGGSVGREGVAVTIAAALADQFNSLIKFSILERKVLLIAAVSAGFGSVFGTPLAGAVFAVEFMQLGKLRYKAILPALFCGFIADYTTTYLGIQHTHYHIGIIPHIGIVKFLSMAAAGLFFGGAAWLFIKGMHYAKLTMNKYVQSPYLKPIVSGVLFIGLTLLFGTDYHSLGIPVIERSFLNQTDWYVFLVKIVFTIVTLSGGFKGGEATPLFFIGATLGSALSFVFPLPVGLLAGAGFIAVFGAATKTPLASIVIGYELFGWEGLVFFGIACLIANLVTGKNSVYEGQHLKQEL